MSESRGHSAAGADPAKIADRDRELFGVLKRHREAADRAAIDPPIPIDMLADPAAARAAIAAKYGDRFTPST